MTEVYREQHPLLNDEFSEEEHFSPHRRFRHMAFRTRARNKVKGAASIIRRWPGFWSSALIYWWIGLGMILITTLLIYNGLTISALLSHESNTAPMIRIDDDMRHSVERKTYLPEIFMHIFFNIEEEIDLTKYLPHIEILSNQYKEYIYNLIVVVNDTTIDHKGSAEENNEIALNSILFGSDINEKKNINGILVEKVSLVKYLDRSPLKKDWRNIPSQFIEFMVRAISVWDKGGIAFNPTILTPQSSTMYKRVQKLLEKYSVKANLNNDSLPKKINNTYNNKKQRLNNIRDIINAMGLEDEAQQNVAEKENNDLLEPAESFLGPLIFNILNDTKMVIDTLSESLLQNKEQNNLKLNENEDSKQLNNNMALSEKYIENNRKKISESSNNLPEVFKYLLKEQNMKESSKPENKSLSSNSIRKRKGILNHNNDKNSKGNSSKDHNLINNEHVVSYMPMIVPANKTISEELIKNYSNYNVISDKKNSVDQLTIGLNGNILATNTSCHAFIGTLFGNVYHHGSEETLTNFIIRELSMFCKGLLSSCDGIDIILL